MRRCRKTSHEIVQDKQQHDGVKRLQSQWRYPKWGNNNLPSDFWKLVKRKTRRNFAQNKAFLLKKALFDVNIIYLSVFLRKNASKECEHAKKHRFITRGRNGEKRLKLEWRRGEGSWSLLDNLAGIWYDMCIN